MSHRSHVLKSRRNRLSLVVGVGISAPLVRVEDFRSELEAGLVAEVTQMPIIGSRIVLSRDQVPPPPNVWL